jgi:hypothetical protein
MAGLGVSFSGCVPLCTCYTRDPSAKQQSLEKSARWRNVASKVCFVVAAGIFVATATVSLIGIFELAIPVIILTIAAGIIVPGFFLAAGSHLMIICNKIISKKKIIDQIMMFQENDVDNGQPCASGSVTEWAKMQRLFWENRITETEKKIKELRKCSDVVDPTCEKLIQAQGKQMKNALLACEIEETELTTFYIEAAVALFAEKGGEGAVQDRQQIGFYPPHQGYAIAVYTKLPTHFDAHFYTMRGDSITHEDLLGRSIGDYPGMAEETPLFTEEEEEEEDDDDDDSFPSASSLVMERTSPSKTFDGPRAEDMLIELAYKIFDRPLDV